MEIIKNLAHKYNVSLSEYPIMAKRVSIAHIASS